MKPLITTKFGEMRLTPIFPMMLAIISFVLSLICVFAGSNRGYMEEQHIITLNTTGLGKNLVAKIFNTTDIKKLFSRDFDIHTKQIIADHEARGLVNNFASSAASAAGALASVVGGEAGSASSAILGAIDSVAATAEKKSNEAIEKLLNEMDVQDFYSLHMLDTCRGDFKPVKNTTTTNETVEYQKSVLYCTDQTAMYKFDVSNITARINDKLESSIFKTNLSKLGLQEIFDTVQDGLESFSRGLNATFIFYAIAIAAAGFLIILTLLMIFKSNTLLNLLAVAVAGIGFLALTLASLVITVVQDKVVGQINDKGSKVGLQAYKGGKYLAITWTSVAGIGVAFFAVFLAWRVNPKEERSENVGLQNPEKRSISSEI